MNLSIMQFQLPDGAGLAEIKSFQKLVTRLDKLTGTIGTNSRWFKQRCDEISNGIKQGQSISGMVREPRDARVVLYLWEHSPAFLSAAPPSRSTLGQLKTVAGGFRAGHLSSLTEVYFQHFDRLSQLSAVTEIISTSLNSLPGKRLAPNLRQLKQSASAVFHSSAPRIIATTAVESRRTFRSCVASMGVPVERPGRFMEACKNEYYVATVERLQPGAPDKVLEEIVRPEVKESPYDKSLNLGQKIAAVMIDKCEKLPDGMPSSWVDTLLSIMGDPRRGHRTAAYQKWWAPMSAKRVALVRKWLAGADLRLFLEILEDSSNDPDLRRMYPDRKAFLEGLLQNYEVQDARLFLGESAASYIARKFSRDAIRAHGKLRDPHKTVIHIQVGGVHLFEGTHNYAARAGRYLPESSRVVKFGEQMYTYQELTSGLEFDLHKAARGQGRNSGSARVVHSRSPTWQHKLILELGRLGLTIHPEHVLTPQKYRIYRKEFGIGR